MTTPSYPARTDTQCLMHAELSKFRAARLEWIREELNPDVRNRLGGFYAALEREFESHIGHPEGECS